MIVSHKITKIWCLAAANERFGNAKYLSNLSSSARDNYCQLDACEEIAVESSKCNCFHSRKLFWTYRLEIVINLLIRSWLRQRCCHFDEISFASCIESCHFDNFQCSQWRKCHQNNEIVVSVLLPPTRSPLASRSVAGSRSFVLTSPQRISTSSLVFHLSSSSWAFWPSPWCQRSVTGQWTGESLDYSPNPSRAECLLRRHKDVS